jgi:hypothetical protein
MILKKKIINDNKFRVFEELKEKEKENYNGEKKNKLNSYTIDIQKTLDKYKEIEEKKLNEFTKKIINERNKNKDKKKDKDSNMKIENEYILEKGNFNINDINILLNKKNIIKEEKEKFELIKILNSPNKEKLFENLNDEEKKRLILNDIDRIFTTNNTDDIYNQGDNNNNININVNNLRIKNEKKLKKKKKVIDVEKKEIKDRINEYMEKAENKEITVIN